MAEPFWQAKPLSAMTRDEWEAVCDGCGKCCLVKLEDEAEPDTVYYTDVACRLLDLDLCRCRDYPNRAARVPSCAVLSPERLDLLGLMPPSCAYRRLHEGRGLPRWHHLVTNDRASVHEAGRSVKGRAVSEEVVSEEEMEDHLVGWPYREG